jgi:hypothetical protein
MTPSPPQHSPDPKKKPSILQTLVSVLGAFFGVQSQKTRERDFESGHPWWIYVLLGIGLAVLFVGSLLLLVEWVLSVAQ